MFSICLIYEKRYFRADLRNFFARSTSKKSFIDEPAIECIAIQIEVQTCLHYAVTIGLIGQSQYFTQAQIKTTFLEFALFRLLLLATCSQLLTTRKTAQL